MSANSIPANANSGCVGPTSQAAGKASACDGCPNQSSCASGESRASALQGDQTNELVKARMAGVKHKILVLSGKGGVGKSTFSAQLAFALAMQENHQVGLLDVDICGPSIPRMLGLVDHEVHQSASGWSPVYIDDNLGVMSIGFMLPSRDDAVIWRGPRKNGLIKQFLTDVVWNDLDFLVIDTPPGTSDEHLSTVQYLKGSGIDGAVIVTTPNEVSMADVRKELNFCKKVGLPVLGVVENMSDIKIPLASLTHPESGIRIVDREGNNCTDSVLSRLRAACPELMDLFIESDLFKAHALSTQQGGGRGGGSAGLLETSEAAGGRAGSAEKNTHSDYYGTLTHSAEAQQQQQQQRQQQKHQQQQQEIMEDQARELHLTTATAGEGAQSMEVGDSMTPLEAAQALCSSFGRHSSSPSEGGTGGSTAAAAAGTAASDPPVKIKQEGERPVVVASPQSMAAQFNVPYLGRLPMDPNLMHACDHGLPFLSTYPNSAAAYPFMQIVQKIIENARSSPIHKTVINGNKMGVDASKAAVSSAKGANVSVNSGVNATTTRVGTAGNETVSAGERSEEALHDNNKISNNNISSSSSSSNNNNNSTNNDSAPGMAALSAASAAVEDSDSSPLSHLHQSSYMGAAVPYPMAGAYPPMGIMYPPPPSAGGGGVGMGYNTAGAAVEGGYLPGHPYAAATARSTAETGASGGGVMYPNMQGAPRNLPQYGEYPAGTEPK